MKQLLFIIFVICLALMMGCQREIALEYPPETNPSVLDATWQEINKTHQTNATEEATSASEERRDKPTETTQSNLEATYTPTEGTTENDKEASVPTETKPNATTPPITETTPKVEETAQPTEATEPATKPPEETKPQVPAVTIPYETTITTPPGTAPTDPQEKPAVTEPHATEPPATTVPVVTVTPTEPEVQPTGSYQPPGPSATEPPAFDIHYWISFAKDYAEKAGLTLDEEAIWCWDNPIAASARSKYLERDICGVLDRYSKDPDITAVWIWSEQRSDSVWNIYIGYA